MRRPLRPTIIVNVPLATPSKPRPTPSPSRAQWLLHTTLRTRNLRPGQLQRKQEEDADATGGMLAPDAKPEHECDRADACDREPAAAVAPDQADAPQPRLAPDPALSASLERRIAQALLDDNRARLAMQRVAAHVAAFCNAAPVRNSGLWEAQLDLREDVLPASRLWMQLSPGSLLLRFRCGTPLAQRLVCAGRQSLHAALQAVLQEHCDVEIEVV
ncbi:HRP-associated protein [Xanthomonas hyacinthi]|uniref:HRP-associated protein n=1 Tax=Xanthomonas hyacinthi TaxID=56455 RepID=A0A2S7ERD4_9XANT|nr:type III secretion system protein SctP [Xanthomonas hyacinthi]KLD76400.1 hypothetical protein Y886_21575 [Xanthomonas hyacinthi DSM 19077]PPU95660.1 HRP-associated protein [Xanthomonas hyacinthi]QGY78070.1 HRP-associated protein [Xanthomonas hyacinthi]